MSDADSEDTSIDYRDEIHESVSLADEIIKRFNEQKAKQQYEKYTKPVIKPVEKIEEPVQEPSNDVNSDAEKLAEYADELRDRLLCDKGNITIRKELTKVLNKMVRSKIITRTIKNHIMESIDIE